jgi:4-hydroxybenzoate polyprenyltransferase/phosphoserine phosphatase
MEQSAEAAVDVPLVVDMDGTLIKIDSLHESFVQLSSKKPLLALRALLLLRHSRGAFKAAVADHILLDAATLPLDEATLETIKRARGAGRKVYLATAADRRFAEAVADEIGPFDGVFASEDGINLKGKAKADRLVAAFGLRGFDYIGNDAADIPIWQVARNALVAGASARLVRRLKNELPEATTVSVGGRSIWPYIRALRPHQWLKNGLVALPAVGAHDFSFGTIVTVLIAMASFSLGASSVYIMNDILDLPNDRAHPQKRHRPIAAGVVSLSHALVLLAIVLSLSIALALSLSWAFILVLIVYIGFSTSYSVYLKRKLMIDVVALAALYGIRVLAGGAATGIPLSHWLVGFCFFIFLSLALVKRASEMIALPVTSVGNIKGRGYRREDLQTIIPLSASSGFVAVMVLALYINSAEVRALYHYPELLWGICVLLVYWLGRVYFLTGRGEMEQDPVIFAATDWISLLTGVLFVVVFLVAL